MRWRQLGYASAGAGLGLGASIGGRAVLPNPLLRAGASVAGVWGASYIDNDAIRHGLQGVLVASIVIDLLHLKSWISYAGAPRSSVRSVEEALTRATPMDASDSVTADYLRSSAPSAVPFRA